MPSGMPSVAPLAPCTRPVFLWKNGREMEDKSKRTDKYEKNVTKIVFSDFSPSFLRFNGHSAAAHCIHQGQTPSNNRTQSLRVTAKASRGPRAAGRARSATPLSEPGGVTRGGVGTRARWRHRQRQLSTRSPRSGQYSGSGSTAMMSSHATTCPRVIPVLRRFFAVSTAYM